MCLLGVVIVFLNFCNAEIFYDYKNVGITCEVNQVHKFIVNCFYKTIPYSKTLVSLSIVDDIILKIHDNDNENIFENLHDLRENILYMLSFERLVKEEQQTVKRFGIMINDV